MRASSTVAVLALTMAVAAAGRGASRDRDAEIESPSPTSKPVFTLYLENDTVAHTDGHYTNGMKLSWFTGDLVTWGQTGWREALVNALPFVNRKEDQKNLGFALGQNIYTPRDVLRVPPDPRDRPYAGWTYLEFSFASRTAKVSDTIAFQLGVVGPHSYAEQIQRWVHDWLDEPEPRGWDYQLRDEIGVNAIYERRLRLVDLRGADPFGFDVVPHVGFSLGNVHTYANAGGTVRLGYHLPRDFGVDLIRAGSSGQAPVLAGGNEPRGFFGAFVFAGVDGRAVARDIFLDGNSLVDGPRVKRETLVADLRVGVGMMIGNWQLTFTRVERTREFRGQAQNSRFGSATVSVAW